MSASNATAYRWESLFETCWQDVRFAARTLRRNPGFTTAAVLAIALGIGANTTIFSVVNAALLRPLPYRDPERLVAVFASNLETRQNDKVTGADFFGWKSRNRVFDDMAYYWDNQYTLTGTTNTESLIGWQFSANLFHLLGASPLVGRTFLPEEGERGKDHVVVLSHRLWLRRFAGDSGIVGRPVQLDGQSYTVIGVMPPTFAHPDNRADLWTPLAIPELATNRALHVLNVIARMRSGASRGQARSELEALARQSAQEHPNTSGRWSVDVRPIRDLYAGDVRATLLVLEAAAFLMLLISCGNAVNLVLVRASGRDREVALRVAIGAGRTRLFGQFLAEGMIIAGLGAAGGVLLGVWGVHTLPRLFSAQFQGFALPGSASGWIDGTVLRWTAIVTLAAGCLFGAAPVVRGLANPEESLKSGGRGSSGRASAGRTRGVLVVGQIAFSLLLLAGAGLLMRSFAGLRSRSFGFRTENVLTIMLSLPPTRYATPEQTTPFAADLLRRARALPGVESAGLISTLPLSGSNARRPFRVPGRADTLDAGANVAEFRVVTPGYFAAMSIPLRKGRVFEDADRTGSPEVVIINQALAHRLWPNEDPVGRSIIVPDQGTFASRVIVGVVGDTRHHGLATEPASEIYRPAYQAYWPWFALVVHTATEPARLAGAVREAVSSIDRNVPLDAVRTMDGLAADSIALRRSSMLLLAVLAAIASLLASFGIYSVIAYTVAQRTKEIGIRMALGAPPRHVAKQVVGEGMALAGAGLGIGLVLTIALTRFLASLLFDVQPTDPATLGAVSMLIFAIAVVAVSVPALSASKVDPIVALRAD